MNSNPINSPSKPERKTIVGLHYVRALATIMVVFYHANATTAFSKYFGRDVLNGFFTPAAGEIDLFFLMSGVIMVIATHSKQTGLPRVGVGEFWLRRAIRILPLLWIAVIATSAGIFAQRGNLPLEDIIRGFILWPVGETVPYTAWTMRYEVLFYIVFGLCFLLQRKAMFLGVLWFVFPLALTLFGNPPTSEDGTFFHFFFGPFNMEFGTGVALGYLYLRFPLPIRVPFQLPIIVLLILLLRASIWFFVDPALSHYSTSHVLILLPVCLLIASLALWTDPDKAFKPMVFLGDASYSIFLFHPLAISPVEHLLKTHAAWMSAELVFAIAILTGVAFGSLIHILIERPLVKFANLKFHTIPSKNARVTAKKVSHSVPLAQQQ